MEGTKTALITGATGLLGRQVVKTFAGRGWSVKGTGFSRADGKEILKVDLADPEHVENTLDEVNVGVMEWGAANRFPDKVDKDPDAARKINVEATRALASACAQRSVFLIYISTDYVFPGKPGDAPYEADAEPAPTNLYGLTKLDGEKAVLAEYEAAGKVGSAVVLRVPVLYGQVSKEGGNAESAVNTLMDVVVNSAKEGAKKVKMDHWAVRYPTNTEDVARVCYDVAVRYIESGAKQSLPRILQFSSEDKYTKYEMCQLFAEIMGLPIDNIEANTEGNDPNATVQRPYDCHLSTRALQELGIDVSTQDFVGWWRKECGAFRH
ncbi:dtdp-4-dehydrorhamnose reductase-like protein [Thermochaetoides thermophila DSM 1495]|uniref:Dtdp-4-dehydrorhamnose reductase-like protein n=1 Tax=Chaetomium thermophilum (strain DSM 1495 / CBS 144.50 / IMI 039719) TaxID=759272 RepID=G0S7S0_CHATD|nr:dtdp-4-dehydrorhamnose reductase-like protein [Thermochaetoides thermophila DSM 1495]EGS21020.1 dtdp-4-dehydrorhamnose reductase-like protein [Thermochaetoides thermophila DSM 1495]